MPTSPRWRTLIGSLRAAMEQYGRLDIVVANAGIEVVGIPMAAVTEADFDRVFDVNTKGGVLHLAHAARRITDNGSIGFPLPGYGLYSGSKMAPRFFVEVLARNSVREALP
jgi:3-oxoacyl-[acyl-carrier protein] reductase